MWLLQRPNWYVATLGVREILHQNFMGPSDVTLQKTVCNVARIPYTTVWHDIKLRLIVVDDLKLRLHKS